MPARPSWARKVATTRRGSVHWRKPFRAAAVSGWIPAPAAEARPRPRRSAMAVRLKGEGGGPRGNHGFPRAKPRRRLKAGLRVRGGVEDAVRTALHLEDEMGLAQRRVAGLEGI